LIPETMKQNDYIMENLEESLRLDQKTDPRVVEKQARWAGLQPGMRVADLGCGSGKTTSVLSEMIKPAGEVIGMDFAPSRYEFATVHYSSSGARFICRDVRESLDDLGSFDFIWVRFFLEYYLSGGFEIIKHISTILKPGGILCLIDLDHNCLNHYGISEKLEKTLLDLSALSQTKGNFDPWAGRKLYSFLYDLGFEQITIDVSAHHLIFGPPNETDVFNWLKKVEVAPKKMAYDFKEYNGSYKNFQKEFLAYFRNPRRFIYTPVIACRGITPAS
jgi:ubiquinone/menaquinone biosynthesis C-methylase UbiE